MTKKPLSSLSDLQLIKLVKGGSSEAFNEICIKYEKIFYNFIHKYSSSLAAVGINFQDILDEKNIIIYNCILSFNPKKGTKLSTHIGNYSRYLCLNSCHSRTFIMNAHSEDITKFLEENQIKNNYTHAGHNIENHDYIYNILGQMKDKRAIKVFKYRYNDRKKMIWSDIAKNLKLSTQTVVNLHSKGIKLIKSKLNSKQISDII